MILVIPHLYTAAAQFIIIMILGKTSRRTPVQSINGTLYAPKLLEFYVLLVSYRCLLWATEKRTGT